MWLANVLLILLIISLASCFIIVYSKELFKSFCVLGSGLQSLLIVILVILIRAVKISILSAIAGGVCGILFKVAAAPINITTTVAVTVGVVFFAVLTIKALIEEWNNLRWSIRNAVQNQYRQR